MPSHWARLSGELGKTLAKVASVISSQSFLEYDNNSGYALKAGSWCGFENLFHGQTS